MEKMSREKAKRSRRGKRKRKEDLEGDGGLGFAGGVNYSDSDDDDGVQQPIEMTAFNRKSKTVKKQRTDSGTDYKERTPTRHNELQLFENDEE